MDMTETDRPGTSAINGYMGRVDAAARGLPPDRRVELLDQLREHLDAVLQGPGAGDSGRNTDPERMGTAGDHGRAPAGSRQFRHPSRRLHGRPGLRLALTRLDDW